MGDMADMMENQAMKELAEFESFVDTDKTKRIWIDKYENEHLILKMSDDHLHNCDKLFSKIELSEYSMRSVMLSWVREEIKDRKRIRDVMSTVPKHK